MTGSNLKEIVVDSSDWEGLLTLMDNADKYEMPYWGTNSDGETVRISVNSANVTVETDQKNGWTRENVYWRDFTTEELFNGRWK